MNKSKSAFWNKQLEYFYEQLERVVNDTGEDANIVSEESDGQYYYITVQTESKDIVPMLDMKMIRFQFSNSKDPFDVFIKVIKDKND